MKRLRFSKMKISGAVLFEPDVFGDARGYFKETFSQSKYAQAGIDDDFVQDNVSCSHAGVLRGLHYDPRMAKLVQCLEGRIYDVMVDLREGSPTYRQWEAAELTGENHRQVYIPRGCAHGFYVLSDRALVMYKQTALYDPAHERTLRFDDPAIGVQWPLNGKAPVMSEKDASAPK